MPPSFMMQSPISKRLWYEVDVNPCQKWLTLCVKKNSKVFRPKTATKPLTQCLLIPNPAVEGANLSKRASEILKCEERV
jgi:hypothetical protein